MSALSIEDYFGPWLNTADATPEIKEDAEHLVEAVNALMALAEFDEVMFHINPHTGTMVSGQTYGGFRPQSCTQGAKNSSHKQGLAVDLFDPQGAIDEWCVNNLDKLEACGIYLESPTDTPGWAHWTIRRPGSGNRVFKP